MELGRAHYYMGRNHPNSRKKHAIGPILSVFALRDLLPRSYFSSRINTAKIDFSLVNNYLLIFPH